MNYVEHPIQLNSEQHRAFAEKVVWQTIGIVNSSLSPSGVGSSDGIGTGSACRWRDQQIILTAKHVIDSSEPSTLCFFLRPTGEVEWNTQPKRVAFSERIPLGIERIVCCQEHDLAAIVLNDDDSGRVSLQYCELPNDFASMPPSGAGVFLAGYPSDQAITVESKRLSNGIVRRSLAAVGNGHWGTIVEEVPSYFPSSFNPDIHFLIEFDPTQVGSMPHGYSGTGVWYQRSGTPEIWAARPVLAGVQTRWHRESKLMIAVRREAIEQFLDESVS